MMVWGPKIFFLLILRVFYDKRILPDYIFLENLCSDLNIWLRIALPLLYPLSPMYFFIAHFVLIIISTLYFKGKITMLQVFVVLLTISVWKLLHLYIVYPNIFSVILKANPGARGPGNWWEIVLAGRATPSIDNSTTSQPFVETGPAVTRPASPLLQPFVQPVPEVVRTLPPVQQPVLRLPVHFTLDFEPPMVIHPQTPFDFVKNTNGWKECVQGLRGYIGTRTFEDQQAIGLTSWQNFSSRPSGGFDNITLQDYAAAAFFMQDKGGLGNYGLLATSGARTSPSRFRSLPGSFFLW